MTDKPFAVARLIDAHAIGVLRVTCAGPDLRFPRFVGLGVIGVNYRFDDGPLVQRIAHLSSDGQGILLWLGEPATRAHIARAKRLRVEIFPNAAPRAFMDFDLSGADKAVAELGCVNR